MDFFLNVNKTCLFCLFVRWKTNTCRLAFFPSARNKQLDILDSHYVFKVRSQSCLESSSTVHQDSIFRTSSFSFLSLQLLCCCRWAFPSRLRTICTRNRFHGNDAQWWNLPKKPGVKAEGLVDFFSQTGGIWHSISCLFVTEPLRLPFSCHSFQLFAGDSFFIIIILQRMHTIYKQTHLPTGIEHCEYFQFFFTSWKTMVLWQEHHSFVSASFIPKAR